MDRDFMLPDVGEGLEEATIVEWLVDVGDHLVVNQPLCVIETAKAEVELPSPYEGTVLIRNGAPGEEMRVGDLLARIAAPDAPAGPDAPGPRGADGATATATPDRMAAGRQSVLVGYGVNDSGAPARRRRAWTSAAAGRSLRTPSPPPPPLPTPPLISAPAGGHRPLAKPPVRKLARDLGVDLAGVRPTGERGEVTRQDVHDAAAHPAPIAVNGSAASPGDEVIPVRGIRARIAERMAVSRSTIPEATCGVEVDCAELLRVRALLKAGLDGEQARSLTPFALIAWMVSRALRSSPLLNSTFDAQAQEIRVKGAVHLGMATSTEQGLLVPVIRDAHTSPVTAFAGQLVALAESARLGSLSPAQLGGSTFTITNYGALGLDEGNPVINHPEVAILGVGAIRQQAVVMDGEVVVRPRTKLICAFDHRVCDGAEAARFLTTLRDLIEEPTRCLLHA